MRIPELIFGHLLTGSNFDDTGTSASSSTGSVESSQSGRMTGGRHGYGAKLTNIFSNRFDLDIYNHRLQQRYQQHWRDHMFICEPPVVTSGAQTGLPQTTGNYTSITFEPDLKRFNLDRSISGSADVIDADKSMSQSGTTDGFSDALLGTIAMMHRRVVDIAACVSSSKRAIEVTLNGRAVPVTSFQAYLDLFNGSSNAVNTAILATEGTGEMPAPVAVQAPSKALYCKVSDRWEVGVASSPSGAFEQMSFVNGVWTPRGGTHVNAVASQVLAAIEEALTKRRAQIGAVMPTAHLLRSRLFLFVRASVESPTFDSQAKDTLTSPARSWGSVPVLPTAFLKNIVQSGIVEDIVADIAMREHARLLRSTAAGGARGSARYVDVPKLEDAHAAGGARR